MADYDSPAAVSSKGRSMPLYAGSTVCQLETPRIRQKADSYRGGLWEVNSAVLQMDQSPLMSNHDSLRPVSSIETRQDYTHVAFDSCFSDAEITGNLSIALASG